MIADLGGLYLQAHLKTGVRRRAQRNITLAGVAIAGTVGLRIAASNDAVVICSSVLATLMATAIPGMWARIVLVPSPPTGLNAEHCASIFGTATRAVPGLVAGRVLLEILGPLIPVSVALITAVACTQPASTTAVTSIGVAATILAASFTQVAGETRDGAPSGPASTNVLIAVVGATLISTGLIVLLAISSPETLIRPTIMWLAAAGLQATASATALGIAVWLLDAKRTTPSQPRQPPKPAAALHQVSLPRLEVRLLLNDQRRRTMALAPAIIACVGLATSEFAGVRTPPSTTSVVACAFLGTMFWKERADDHGLRQLLHQLPHGKQREMLARAAAWLPVALPIVAVAGILHGPFAATLTALMSVQALAVGSSSIAKTLQRSWIRVYFRMLATILAFAIVEQSAYLVGAHYINTAVAAAAATTTGCLISATLIQRTRKSFNLFHPLDQPLPTQPPPGLPSPTQSGNTRRYRPWP